jgi:hypothetical protein
MSSSNAPREIYFVSTICKQRSLFYAALRPPKYLKIAFYLQMEEN